MTTRPSLPLRALNHISVTCRSLSKSMDFYENVLGFMQVKRPDAALKFDGAWLFNYGVGVHLLKGDDITDLKPRKTEINPQSDHLSFQSDDLGEAERRLREFSIPFVKRLVSEDGITISQIFFHDPDDNMIEICNCESLPIVPLGICTRSKRTKSQTETPSPSLDCINGEDAEDAKRALRGSMARENSCSLDSERNLDLKPGAPRKSSSFAPVMELATPAVSDMATCA